MASAGLESFRSKFHKVSASFTGRFPNESFVFPSAFFLQEMGKHRRDLWTHFLVISKAVPGRQKRCSASVRALEGFGKPFTNAGPCYALSSRRSSSVLLQPPCVVFQALKPRLKRVFSAADWKVVHGWPFFLMARDVFFRWNLTQLSQK